MDKSLNPFAPIVHDDRAARALILETSKQITEFVRAHDEAAASQDHEAKERANVQRGELKKIFEKLQGFVPDAEKPPTAKSLEGIETTRREAEITLINHETFIGISDDLPDDTELDDLIHRLSTTNIIAHENDDNNKTNHEREVDSTHRAKDPITEFNDSNEQNDKSVEVETPGIAEIATAEVVNEQTTHRTSSNGEAKFPCQQDAASRRSRRSKGKTSTVASSRREAEKEKNEVKIRFLEEKAALEEEIQRMELKAKMQAEEAKMQVESAKRRLQVETLKAEAKRDDELARIEEEHDAGDDEFDDDVTSRAESVDRWVASTVSVKGIPDVKGRTDDRTQTAHVDEQTTVRPQDGGINVLGGRIHATSNPGFEANASYLPSPCPPESNFFNTKSFFAQKAPEDASPGATHKVFPRENQFPEELREFFIPKTTNGSPPSERPPKDAPPKDDWRDDTPPKKSDAGNATPTTTPHATVVNSPTTQLNTSSAFEKMYEAQLAQIAQNLLVQSRPPKEKLFSGTDKKIDFESYWTRFEHVTKMQGTTPTMVVLEIPHWFTGPAAIIIEKYGNIQDPSEALRRMKEHLRSEFGRQNLTAKKMLDQLLEGPQVQVKESEALQTFIFRLETVYQRAVETGRTVTFNTPEIYNTILHRKLTPLLMRWAIEVVKHDKKFAKNGSAVPDMTFEDFIEFLKTQQQITAYRDAMDGEKAPTAPKSNPRFGSRGSDRAATSKFASTDILEEEVTTSADIAATDADNGQTRPEFQNRGRPQTRVNPNHNPVPNQRSGPKREGIRPRDPGVCRLCKATDGHKLDKCPTFISSQDRVSDCWKSGHCFNCLEHGHVVAQCPHGPMCSKCDGKHHEMLHREPRNNAGGGGPSSQ